MRDLNKEEEEEQRILKELWGEKMHVPLKTKSVIAIQGLDTAPC